MIGGLLFAAALFYIEVQVNTKLLGPAMTGGEAEGQGISLAVAALNVIISFLAGYFLVKNFNLHGSLKRTISKFVLAFYAIFIIYLNWGLGAFRAIAEQKGQVVQWGQTEAVVSQATEFGNALYPWTVSWSPYAAVLTCVGIGFALFSLGEYANMLLMSSLNVILFFGGWLPPFGILSFIPGAIWFGIKISFFVILFVWMRAALPRYRYDQLMGLGWKVFLPISLGYLMLTFFTLISFNMMPY